MKTLLFLLKTKLKRDWRKLKVSKSSITMMLVFMLFSTTIKNYQKKEVVLLYLLSIILIGFYTELSLIKILGMLLVKLD